MPWNFRKVSYREKGSVRFTRQELESYALIVDVTIISVVRIPYQNLKSNPTESFYGRATIFQGAVPQELVSVPFPRYRLLNLRNEQAANTYNQLAIAADNNRQLTDLGEVVEAVWTNLQGFKLAPLLTHRPNVVKFVGLPKSQFELEVYHLPFEDGIGFELPPTDDDPTTGFSEYFEPRVTDPSDPFAGNPSPSEIPDDSDERDFADQSAPAGLLDGTLNYEFRRGDTGLFDNAQPKSVRWPGQMVVGTAAGFQNVISWQDDEGVQTVMVQQNAGSIAEVRFVGFTSDGGELFVPDPNSFSVGP